MVSSGCLLPGSTGEVVVKGEFAPDTKFVFENDSVEIVKESLTATEYHATVQVAAGTGPQSAAVWAMSPVSGIVARQSPGIAIGGRYQWEAERQQRVENRSRRPTNKACGGTADVRRPVRSELLPQRGDRAFREAPRVALPRYWEGAYRFSISQEDPQAQAGMQDMARVMQKLTDPKLTDAQRDQIDEAAPGRAATGAGKYGQDDGPELHQAAGSQTPAVRLYASGTEGRREPTSQALCIRAPAAGQRIPVTGTITYLGK